MNPGETLSCVTTDDKNLPGIFWRSAEERAVIAVIHGLGEHSRRYAALAAKANTLGFSVLAADLRGHGLAAGLRCYVDHFDDYVLDARAIVATARARAEGKPLFLLGHSMGGAIALRFLELMPEWRAPLAGIVFSSPAVSIGPGISPFLLKLLPLVARIAPRLRVTALNPKLISRVAEQVVAYEADTLVAHRPPPLRTAHGLIAAMATFMPTARHLKLPMYVFHGDADALTSCEGSRTLYQNWGGADKVLRVWPGSYHEVLNDSDAAAAAAEVLAWLEIQRNKV